MEYFQNLNINAKSILLLQTLLNNTPDSMFDVYISTEDKLKSEILSHLNINLNQSFFKYIDEVSANINSLRLYLINKINLDTDLLNQLKTNFNEETLNELELFEYNEYWNNIKRHDRESYRLIYKLKDFYYEQDDCTDIHLFLYTKRPWGNKDIPASIVYNLGWDKERRLTRNTLPDHVRKQANDIYENLKLTLKG